MPPSRPMLQAQEGARGSAWPGGRPGGGGACQLAALGELLLPAAALAVAPLCDTWYWQSILPSS